MEIELENIAQPNRAGRAQQVGMEQLKQMVYMMMKRNEDWAKEMTEMRKEIVALRRARGETVAPPEEVKLPKWSIPEMFSMTAHRQDLQVEEQVDRVRSDKPDDLGCDVETLDQHEESSNFTPLIGDCLCTRDEKLKDLRSVNFEETPRDVLTQDVNMRRVDVIQALTNRNINHSDVQGSVHTIEVNLNSSMLATGAHNSSDRAVCRLPTRDPVCLGENRYQKVVMEKCWSDDEVIVSGSEVSRLALGCANEDDIKFPDCGPIFDTINPIFVKDCHTEKRLWSLCSNNEFKEIAALSLNDYMHMFNVETFKQKFSRKLTDCQYNVILIYYFYKLCVVAYRSFIMLSDARTLQNIRKLTSRDMGGDTRDTSPEGNLITICTGLGILLYSEGVVYAEYEIDVFQQVKYQKVTHCYDNIRISIFTAGGPLLVLLVELMVGNSNCKASL
ncbi:DDB1- and CUL4-associated factor 12-like [Teleopsis dalmanni]|uniref:DDB1- and CUL4-associated factor 12-like n=1 Tax=Teleopsis dalmanni TaxID=139649 RepID=UPI0018CF7F66|nr:DDB1- and CUL4-associated factor 12-like [Teleopsis dalmanni]XP_037930375.1 DDB1- and CUL4-associated factor 12-like [Teleopsis dalmanni]XP_037944404.1 DDB1- and CUL4-associated factor 12-like [Teleopsis dalmanni]